jgi:GDPmannose 4,6-dehydratase
VGKGLPGPTAGHPRVKLHYGDVLDPYCLFNILSSEKVDEIYHLAAQSHVAISFEVPQYTSDVDALGTLRLLQTIRALDLQRKVKFYNVNMLESTWLQLT